MMSAFQHMGLGSFVGHGFNPPARRGPSRLVSVATLVGLAAAAVVSFDFMKSVGTLSDRSAEIHTAAANIGTHMEHFERQATDIDRKQSDRLSKLDDALSRFDAETNRLKSMIDQQQAAQVLASQSDLVVHPTRSPAVARKCGVGKATCGNVGSKRVKKADTRPHRRRPGHRFGAAGP